MSGTSEPREIRIPVPWGHISAKCWGPEDGLPMLGVHGLQDNANTFDRLAPLLPGNFLLVSIDLPGHGLSSYLPPGVLYQLLDMVTVIARVANHLKWDRFYYLGHSLGGQIGSYFAAFYPDRIIKLILLDAVKPRPLPQENYIPSLCSAYERLFKMEKKISDDKMPCYTYEEAKQRVIDTRFSELTPSSLDILLKRSLRPFNGGFVFGQDQRLKFFVFPPHTIEQQINILSNVKCSLLIIKARDTLPIFLLRSIKIVTEMYRHNCAHFEDLIVEGNHDVHLNYPERVATLISNFLLHNKSRL